MSSCLKRSRIAGSVASSGRMTLSAIVSRCLEREPANRYHSSVELLQQLTTWEANPNISAETLSKMISHPIVRPSRFSLDLPGKSWMWIAGAVLVIALATFAGRTLLNRTGTSYGEMARGIPSLKQGKYVAILPLKKVGDEKAVGYVADGIGEALAAKLFQLKEVHLASSDSVDKAAAKDMPLFKLARELGVNLVLQGSVQGSSDKLRVTLGLDDATTGKRVWSQEFSGASGDVLTLEDQIYSTVATALALKPTDEEQARKKSAKEISSVMPSVLKRIGLDEKLSHLEVLKVWNNLLDPLIVAHAQPVGLVKGTLFVNVDSSVWLSEIVRYRRKEILKRLQHSFGPDLIVRISFRIG